MGAPGRNSRASRLDGAGSGLAGAGPLEKGKQEGCLQYLFLMPPELPGQAQNGKQRGELVERSKEAKKPPVEAIYLNVICGGVYLKSLFYTLTS